MKLWAISDLHLGHRVNREHLDGIGRAPDDWLILAGDVGETEAHLAMAFATLRERFARLIWVPGNHELWASGGLRGEARYASSVALARSYGVVTPEDPWPVWPGTGAVIVPMFTLYDYTFHPDHVPQDRVLAWAAERGIVCADEYFLSPAPHPGRAAWCAARVAVTEDRLDALPEGCATVLVNHFPLKRAHAWLPRIPRFSPWCGTMRTEDWPGRYRAAAVVYGHLHIRRSFAEAGIAFHEVSLGYPKQWDQGRPMASYLRRVL